MDNKIIVVEEDGFDDYIKIITQQFNDQQAKKKKRKKRKKNQDFWNFDQNQILEFDKKINDSNKFQKETLYESL